ncbi:PREDICTED: heterogeneous nuclear ribonucleoprotein 1 [Tarenaya hassleriana]|uniref:heterogeneous nuclear ribonucleoprotein 1 n=1 Tax=Tarenaya hassleriana TaxID=28532 RepID=UPI00053C0E62|nr:PREDICTED: heterogeneous nuclear ribonucleoprotein 1 [Tarenaya hassleriana]
MGFTSKNENFHSGDGASPGKIFIGGLPKDATYAVFNKHFGNYGEITDSVIMRDRHSGQPRGFGFITYADPSVVDKVIEDNHIINGKQVEIKRTIPKGAGGSQTKDIKTKKIFVGGVPSSVTEDEFRDFFSKYGNVMEHQIIHDRETNRSRGFGFIIFDSEEVVDELLSKGNMIDMADTQVEIKKAEPKKSSNQPPAPYGSNPRGRSFNDNYGRFGGPYGGFDGGYGPGPLRSHGGPGSRFGGGYGYGGGRGNGEFGGGYGGYGGGSVGGYRGEPSLGYPSRFGPYGGGGGYGGGGYGSSVGYGGMGLGGYSRGGEGYGGYSGAGYGGAFEPGPGASYEGAGGFYGRGYSGSSRYHPYAR